MYGRFDAARSRDLSSQPDLQYLYKHQMLHAVSPDSRLSPGSTHYWILFLHDAAASGNSPAIAAIAMFQRQSHPVYGSGS